jgi:protein gp37
MGQLIKTKIEWATDTWNPLIGCQKVSEGCKNCYAEKMAKRLAVMFPSYAIPGSPAGAYKDAIDENGQWTGVRSLIIERLSWLRYDRKPRLIFVCSMCDLFYHLVFNIDKVHFVMKQSPQHTYLLLTKRHENMFHYYQTDRAEYLTKNIWLGVSAEDQKNADTRIPSLLSIKNKYSNFFVSIEPMLGPVDISKYLVGENRLKWVICGAETGPKKDRRPVDIDWVRSLRDQCRANNVAFMLKQLFIDGKKISLPELDGEKWVQFPKF